MSPTIGTSSTAPIVEVGFTNNALDEPVTWVDVSTFVQQVSWTRGRQHELGRFEAGTATIVLNNRDGRFSPFYSGGPYGANVVPFKPVRIRAPWSGTTYPQFRGFIETWKVQWADPVNNTVVASCVDATKVLNLRTAASLSLYPPAVLADSPSYYYRLGDPASSSSLSTSAADSSGHNRTGTIATFTPGALIAPEPNAYTAPKFGAAGALTADTSTAWDTGGFAGYVQGTGYTISSPGPFSVEAWIKVRSVGPGGGLNNVIWAAGPGIFVSNVVLSVNGDGTVQLSTFDGTNGVKFSTTRPVTDGAWHHVVATLSADGRTGAIYVDGIQNATSTAPTATSNLSSVNQFFFSDVLFDGFIQEAAVYPTALTPTQVYNHYAAGALPLAGQTSGQRIGSLLDHVAWPAGLRTIDTGASIIQPATDDFISKVVLANVQDVADTEGGYLFVDAAGKITFYDRFHTSKGTFAVAQVVLGDSGVLGTEEPYLLGSTDLTSDDLDIYNEVAVTPAGQGAQTVGDTASQTAYGIRTLSISTLDASPDAALGRAQADLARYKQPLERVATVSFTPMSDPANLWPAALGYELLTRVTLKRRPQDNTGSAFAQDALIEGITHSVDGDTGLWTTTWRLSPTDATPLYWSIGDPISGKIVANPLVGIGW